MREEHSHEAQGRQLHPPALLCQHHVQLCQGNPQQEDSEQVIFLAVQSMHAAYWGEIKANIAISRIYIHKTLGDLEQRVGGVEILPEEYGGTISISTMARLVF